jgi:hypothetical protein
MPYQARLGAPGLLQHMMARGIERLFQNRYKSVVCEEDPYLLELIRYNHLNPLRARIVADLKELDKYPWTGHSKNPLLPKEPNKPNKPEKPLAEKTLEDVLLPVIPRKLLAEDTVNSSKTESIKAPARIFRAVAWSEALEERKHGSSGERKKTESEVMQGFLGAGFL